MDSRDRHQGLAQVQRPTPVKCSASLRKGSYRWRGYTRYTSCGPDQHKGGQLDSCGVGVCSEVFHSGSSQCWRTTLEQANENVSGLLRALLDRNTSRRVTEMRSDRIHACLAARLCFPFHRSWPNIVVGSVHVSTDARSVHFITLFV